MKEIMAVIRPEKARKTKEKLAEKGLAACTEERALGRGQQMGLRYAHPDGEPDESAGISFLPKRVLTLFVNDEDVEKTLSVLIEANRTGEIGDGKIFVCPLEKAVRIRTDEAGHQALTNQTEGTLHAAT